MLTSYSPEPQSAPQYRGSPADCLQKELGKNRMIFVAGSWHEHLEKSWIYTHTGGDWVKSWADGDHTKHQSNLSLSVASSVGQL